jgi:beta-ketoacyl synthase-like protein
MDILTVYVDGIGFWAPGLADWAAAERALCADVAPQTDANARPSACALPPTERRRAPEPVLIASEAAGQACAMAQRDPATLPCVFSSTRGDLAITDAMCTTLAADPRELSPTRFHNSVHNAPAGYWTVATHCHATATAISAGDSSFAAALLEAAIQVHADGGPVLLAAYDIAARGPLVDVAPSTLPFAMAFVLSATRSSTSRAWLQLRHTAEAAGVAGVPAPFAALAGNPMAAQTLPMLIVIARQQTTKVVLGSGRATSLHVEVAP